MKISTIFGLLIAIPFNLLQTSAIAPVLAQTPPNKNTPLCLADLAAEISAIQKQTPRDRWGILVQPLNSETPLYSENAQAYFTPASNVKLLTTAAALVKFGPDYRIVTPIYASGLPPTLSRLHIAGRGDPSLTNEHLNAIAQQLKSQGVNTISELWIEDTHFSTPGINGTWEYDDVHYYYGTAVNSLILNRNHFDLILQPQNLNEPVQMTWNDDIAAQQWQIVNHALTAAPDTPYNISIHGQLGEPQLHIRGELALDAGSDLWGIAYRDPTAYFRDRLLQILSENGIHVVQTRLISDPILPDTNAQSLAIHSPNLAVLIQNTNQPSDNLYAEALLYKIGISLGFPATIENGLTALQDILADIGVNPDSYSLQDGSGLSRQNLVSPEALVQTLIAMNNSPYAAVYRDSLPLAGENGTLRRRFQDTLFQGQLRAKTGTLTGVSALSGYLEVQDYGTVAFSILLNHSTAPTSVQQAAIDEIVLLFSRLQRCDRVSDSQDGV
ncbi:MAG: D-alanyl-D-alanine carboxypeptidase/D-alanyl-D-alanine-endopeptidase [Jaaginema sp. PMC 1079.18]|nr:D-alanyl-D-alanine carboxypeptidase/D-alanyl-D-alanine-endopeptidase [Jaaginema sp. PMC 1080.18]MEC4850944.1 D-alanyl-D-alanine carboxypeptidase/D-alanyl-D-alanine-endopeptidase [Jaaginema sp. PMC 1079.18]MEC4867064.1 D-alanyl-D-alanine carboxypeptidase/D-alanyl-D-alanine-endopeptidase [Jaaginema sp. PMC 1078.18]